MYIDNTTTQIKVHPRDTTLSTIYVKIVDLTTNLEQIDTQTVQVYDTSYIYVNLENFEFRNRSQYRMSIVNGESVNIYHTILDYFYEITDLYLEYPKKIYEYKTYER